MFNDANVNLVGSDQQLRQLRRLTMVRSRKTNHHTCSTCADYENSQEAHGNVNWADLPGDVTLALRDYLVALRPGVEAALNSFAGSMGDIFSYENMGNVSIGKPSADWADDEEDTGPSIIGAMFRDWALQLYQETCDRAEDAAKSFPPDLPTPESPTFENTRISTNAFAPILNPWDPEMSKAFAAATVWGWHAATQNERQHSR